MIPVGIISGVEVPSGEVSRGGAGGAAAGVVRVAKQLHVQLGAKVIQKIYLRHLNVRTLWQYQASKLNEL